MTTRYAWQQPDWRTFRYDLPDLAYYEQQFSHHTGIVIGIQKALSAAEQEAIKFSFLSEEALTTSEIEGEFLDRASLQSSIQRYFQLQTPHPHSSPRENGIANMLVDVYLNFAAPLTHEMLFAWHTMVLNGRTDLSTVGQYRFHQEPMQIISANSDRPKIYYQAPPSARVPAEMELFIAWFNQSRTTTTPLLRAGIAHAYFELIHPFEDGNGRIGRALIEKALAQAFDQPTLIAVSQTIQQQKKAYYQALSSVNKSNDFSAWLTYFCNMIGQAQQFSIASIEFLIKKAQFFDTYADQLNSRQLKMIQRIFAEKLDGFRGGVSVKNYVSVTKASPATANRDLNDLVAKGIMRRTGEFKATRYWFEGTK